MKVRAAKDDDCWLVQRFVTIDLPELVRSRAGTECVRAPV